MTTVETFQVSQTARSRGWCFTLNNYVDADLEIHLTTPSVKYCVIGREVGESGTPHLQGYIYFAEKKSLKQLKELYPRAHFQIAKGTAQENYVYCTKDGNFVEHGVRPATQFEKGARGAAAIAEQWELAKKGRFEELPPQNIKTWEYIRAKYGETVSDRVSLKNLWIHGPSGSGKSRWVRETFSPVYWKGLNKWWDGYAGESYVVIEDIDPTHRPWLGYFLKIWADHYSFNAECKGGMLRVRPDWIIVTSQYSIEEVFGEEKTVEALNRRFCIRNMESSLEFVLPFDL